MVISVGTGPGSNYTCGIAADGTAYCWGANSRGQLGDGSLMDRVAPALVHGGLDFAAITAGRAHTCGITINSVAYCWGWGEAGQLGNGASEDINIPSRVFGQP